MARFVLVVMEETPSHVRFQLRVGNDDALAGRLVMRPDEWAAFRAVMERGGFPASDVEVRCRLGGDGGDLAAHLP